MGALGFKERTILIIPSLDSSGTDKMFEMIVALLQAGSGYVLPPPPPIPVYQSKYQLALHFCENDLSNLSLPGNLTYAFEVSPSSSAAEKQAAANALLVQSAIDKRQLANPFASATLLDRATVLRARESCRSDPRAAVLTPERARAEMGALLTSRALCTAVRQLAPILRDNHLQAIMAMGVNRPGDIDIVEQTLRSDLEVAGDVDAACGPTAEEPSITEAKSLLAQLELTASQLAANPDLAPLLDQFAASVRSEASKLAASTESMEPCAQINSMRSNFERRVSKRAIERRREVGHLTKSHQAAFALEDACWKDVPAVKAAAQAMLAAY